MSGKSAKKLRREVKKLQGTLASDLKGWLYVLPLADRIWIAARIIFRRKW